MPLFIKAKTGQSRTIAVTLPKFPAGYEHASPSPFCRRKGLKIRKSGSKTKEVPGRPNRHDKMPRSALSTPASSVDDTNVNKKYDDASRVEMATDFAPIRDRLRTKTSILQDETMEECLPLLAAFEDSQPGPAGLRSAGIPRLDREKHIGFLHQCLKPLAAAYVGFDASRPWILYWVLAALTLLGEDVQPYQER